MSKKQITQNSIAVLAAFLAVCGINFLYQIRGTSTMLSNSVTAMLMFGAFTYVGAQFLKKAVNARLLVYGAAGGMMFAAFAACGYWQACQKRTRLLKQEQKEYNKKTEQWKQRKRTD